MFSVAFAIDRDTGEVQMSFDFEVGHVCVNMTPSEYAEFVSMANGALGDSKLAAS